MARPESERSNGPAAEPGEGGTRGRVVDCVRHGVDTVEAIAAALGLTDNAVRFHVAALEAAKVLQRAGVVRTGGVGKPATIYQLTETAEERYSRAYATVLTAYVEELGERTSPEDLRTLVQSVGARLAAGMERPTGSLESRIRGAAGVLEALGGIVSVTESPEGIVIAGASCPLASVVSHESATCGTVQGLLSELIGAPVAEACDHTERPRCRFLVRRADAA